MKRNTHSSMLVIALALILASCTSSPYVWDDNKLCDKEGNQVGFIQASATEGITSSYDIRPVKSADKGSTTFCVKFTFKAEKDLPDVRMNVDFIHTSPAEWWMIPSVSYNGNEWGNAQELKGAQKDGQWRTYSYRRTPIPGIVYSEGKTFAVATWSDIPQKTEDDFSCSVMPEQHAVTHRQLWPEEEMPNSHSGRDAFVNGWQRKAGMKAGEKRNLVMYVNVSPIESNHSSLQHFMNHCWRTMEHPKIHVPATDEIWRLGITFCRESLLTKEDSIKAFNIGLWPSGDNEWMKRPSAPYEAGWCGQNISIACSFLTDYLRNGDKRSLDEGLAVLDWWVAKGRYPNGLFATNMNLKGTPYEVSDACNLGTSALNYLRAYDLAKECGIEKPEYRDLAYGICDFVMKDQQSNGCFGRGWKQDGTCTLREGTVGAFLVPALLQAFKASGKEEYLNSAKKAHVYYTAELLRDGYSTAGALDCWCIDKESSISLLRGALGLYKITNEEHYLQEALAASYYLSTWLWHYNGHYAEDDAFTQYGYHTFGATSVSVQHHCLDYYACLWVPEWLELADLTGDKQWKEKALAIWHNCGQLISDGNLVINGRTRPVGSQNEVYFESSWDQYNRNAGICPPPVSVPNRLNDWLVAWPSAFRLETLCKTQIKE